MKQSKKNPPEVIYAVICNLGGGLWNRVEKLKPDKTSFRMGHGMYVSADENSCYEMKDISKEELNKDGHKAKFFKNKKDAQLFLQGAKFFQKLSKLLFRITVIEN